MKKSGFSTSLRRIQIDRTIAKLNKVPLSRPQEGWIRTVRQILGMTQKQLAARMSVTPPSLLRLEKAEVHGSTTIKMLERAASSLHCKMVYVLVPECGSFETLLHQKAQEAAERIVKRASASMHLEGQGVDADFQKRQIQELTAELIRTSDKRIWEMSE